MNTESLTMPMAYMGIIGNSAKNHNAKVHMRCESPMLRQNTTTEANDDAVITAWTTL